jgi:hypothetical protein
MATVSTAAASSSASSAKLTKPSDSTNFATIFIILIIFIIFFGVSFMIQDVKYRVCYYMVLALLFLASLNIYLSIVYYIQLRNTPGVQGPIGPKGPKGMTGSTGKCSFSQTCGIQEPREKIIIPAVKLMYPNIPQNCLDNPSLANCNNDQDILDQARPINAQINMLEQIAQNSSMTENDFNDKIKVCLTDTNSCMDPTDF